MCKPAQWAEFKAILIILPNTTLDQVSLNILDFVHAYDLSHSLFFFIQAFRIVTKKLFVAIQEQATGQIWPGSISLPTSYLYSFVLWDSLPYY